MMRWLSLLILGLSLQARAQGISTTTAAPNNQLTEIQEPSEETQEFSGTDAEGGSSFRLLNRTWNPSAFNVASMESDSLDNGARLSTYSYFTFGTRVGQNLRFKVRLPFVYNSAGTDRFDGNKVNKDQLLMQDIILELSSSNFLLIPYDVGIYWEGRVYTPNSQASRQAQQIAHFRSDIILEKNLTHTWALEYQNQIGYYQQSRRTYPISFQDENGFTVNALSNTKNWDINHWLVLWAKATPQFSVGAEVGQEQVGYNQSAAENKFKSDLRTYKLGPNLRYQTSGGTRFILTYEDKVDRDSNLAELGRFRAKNTQVSLLSWIAF